MIHFLLQRYSWLLVWGLLWGIPPLPSQAQCLALTSCQPGSASTNNLGFQFGIFRVQVATLDTTTRGASDGYQDYSCRGAARLDRGTTYTLRVSTGPVADENVRAWVDFNSDGHFDSATEQVLTSSGKQHTGTFTVPITLAVGAGLRLRIAADYVDAPLPGPCTTPHYSQTEDYRLLITGALPPRPQAAFSSKDSLSCSGIVQLRDASRNSPTAWAWDLGDGTHSNQQHPQHAYITPGTYTVHLRVSNASGSDSLTKPAFVHVRADGPKPSTCQPATLAYCCDFGLVRVRLAELDHRPGGGAAGYQDASCAHRATLRADWPDTLRLTTGGQGAHDVRVYLDLNNDGRFDATTELLYQALGVRNPLIPLRLNSRVPGLVYDTALRLRIWTDYAGSPAVGPCASPEMGQVVDYSVQVLPNTLAPQAAFTLTYTRTCGPLQVSLLDRSVGNSSATWDFGDGTTSTASSPLVHSYATPGAHTIRLVATTASGADTVRQEIAVAASCPSYCEANGYGGNDDVPVYFTRVKIAEVDNTEFRASHVGYRDFTHYVATVRQGQTVALHAESLPWSYVDTTPHDGVMGWADFNHDGQFTKSELIMQVNSFSPHEATFHIPPNAQLGATRLRLIIFYADYYYHNTFPLTACSPPGFIGATEEYTLMVLPEHQAPQPGFTADLTASCSGQIQFTDTTGAAPRAWHWDFGDGTTSTQASPSHTYAAPGQYTVTLQASNDYGSAMVRRPQYINVLGLAQGPPPATVQFQPWQPGAGYLIGLDSFRLATRTYRDGAKQPGYQDETCQQPAWHLAAGGTYPVQVQLKHGFPTTEAYLWLDANDDGRFTPDEWIFTSPQPSSDPTKIGTLTVPATALRGRPLRLRLLLHGLRYEDYKHVWPVPDPQTHDEEVDEMRDFTVWVSGPLATTAATTTREWAVYPNPTAGMVTLTNLPDKQPVQVTVRNVLGQLVGHLLVLPTSMGTAQLDLTGLAKGLYFLQLSASTPPKRVVVY